MGSIPFVFHCTALVCLCVSYQVSHHDLAGEGTVYVCVCVFGGVGEGHFPSKIGCACHTFCLLPWSASKGPSCVGDTQICGHSVPVLCKTSLVSLKS